MFGNICAICILVGVEFRLWKAGGNWMLAARTKAHNWSKTNLQFLLGALSLAFECILRFPVVLEMTAASGLVLGRCSVRSQVVWCWAVSGGFVTGVSWTLSSALFSAFSLTWFWQLLKLVWPVFWSVQRTLNSYVKPFSVNQSWSVLLAMKNWVPWVWELFWQLLCLLLWCFVHTFLLLVLLG